MPSVTKTFRVFVSSTFEDLKEERNRLHETVYPNLRAFCQEHGASFQAIDLRWGVSEEASLDQQTMKICLCEIKRCRDMTPRPNFLVLLGQRYGWVPLPTEIPDDEFQQLLGVTDPSNRERLVYCASKDGDESTGWYRLDENAAEPAWVLQPRTGKYRDAKEWRETEAELHRILQQAVDQLSYTEEQKVKYFASATEQEIRAGVLQQPDTEGKVFSFFRTLEGARQDENRLLEGTAAYIDHNENLIKALKAKLNPTWKYTAEWDPGEKRPKIVHLEELAVRVESALKAAIQQELDEPTKAAGTAEERHVKPDDKLDAEGRAHCEFANGLLEFFIGRQDLRRAVAKYVGKKRERILVILAGGGVGKSALMAKVIKETREAHGDAEIVYRFIGATPDSSNGRALLDSLCRELARRYGVEEETPHEYLDLVMEFRKRLKMATAERSLILFVDALDQLLDRHSARNLSWLPDTLPENVRMVISTRPDESLLNSLGSKQPEMIEVGPMSRVDGEEVLGQWLTAAGRKLQPLQTEEVLAKFWQSEGRPLYLKLAFEEACHWASWEPPKELAPGISPDVETGQPGIIRKNLLNRLAHEDNHGSQLVACALGYLAASRYGVAEHEMIEILSRDPELYASLFKRFFYLPPDLLSQAEEYLSNRKADPPAADKWLTELHDEESKADELSAFLAEVLPKQKGPRLPVVLWSRLFFDLAPYLTERETDGVNVLAFYHSEFHDSVAEEYLVDIDSRNLHGRLAAYFRSKSDPKADRSWAGNYPRGLAELPYHLTEAADWQEVYETLTNFPFLEHKASEVGVVETKASEGQTTKLYTGVLKLQEDFDHALAKMPGSNASVRAKRPIIVTPADFGDGHVIRCPFCITLVPFQDKWLGQEIPCPVEGCGGRWKVNPFVCVRPGWAGKKAQ